MFNVVSFAELEELHVEMIPGRTLMQTGPIYEDPEGVRYENLYFDEDLDELELEEDLDEELEPFGLLATDPRPSPAG